MRVALGSLLVLALLGIVPAASAAEGDVVVATQGAGDTRDQQYPPEQDVRRLDARSDIGTRRRQVTVTLEAAPTAATDAAITISWGRRQDGPVASCVVMEKRSTRTFAPSSIVTRTGAVLTFDYRGSAQERHDCVAVTVMADGASFWDSELLWLTPITRPGPVLRLAKPAAPIYTGRQTTVPLTISNVGGGDLRTATVTASGSGLQAPAAPLSALPAGATSTVDLTLTPTTGKKKRVLIATVTGTGPASVPVCLEASTTLVVRDRGQHPREGSWRGKHASFRVNTRGVVRRLEASVPRGCGHRARTIELTRLRPNSSWWIDTSVGDGPHDVQVRMRLLKDKIRQGRVKVTVNGCTVARKIQARRLT